MKKLWVVTYRSKERNECTALPVIAENSDEAISRFQRIVDVTSGVVTP